MIENDITKHLIADKTLMDLLGGNIANKYKLFLMRAEPEIVPPFIVYEVNTNAINYEDIIETDNFQFNIFTTAGTTCRKIANRLKKLLSISDDLNNSTTTKISSSEYYIYSGLHTGTDNYINDTETKVFILPMNFKFAYKRKIV